MSSVMRFDEWQDSDGNPVFNGAGGVSPGGLVAVKSAIFTGTQSASVTAGDNLSVTDLSIAHEVADASNKLIISAFIGTTGSSESRAQVGIAVNDGTGLIAVGASPGSRTAVTAGSVNGGTGAFVTHSPSVTFVHTPGAGSKTYTVRAVNLRAATVTLFINRPQDDSDGGNTARAVSSLVIQEVAV